MVPPFLTINDLEVSTTFDWSAPKISALASQAEALSRSFQPIRGRAGPLPGTAGP